MTEREYFTKNCTMLVDTREQKNFDVLKTFEHYGIRYQFETFSTGDYSFVVGEYNYKDKWLGERKGSLNELYGNVMSGNLDKNSTLRNNLEEELKRKVDAGVQEFILFLQGVNNLAEAKDWKNKRANKQGDRAGLHIYSTIMSWSASNRYNFKVCCQPTQEQLAVEMINHAYYFWRNDMKDKFGDRFLKILQGVKGR